MSEFRDIAAKCLLSFPWIFYLLYIGKIAPFFYADSKRFLHITVSFFFSRRLLGQGPNILNHRKEKNTAWVS